MTTRVKVTDFIASAKQYISKSVDEGKLPKDLRDNVAKTKRPVGKKRLKATLTKYVAANARKADKNKDGFLSAAKQKTLPKDLQDNLKHFVRATNTLSKVSTSVSRTRNELFDRLERGVAKHDWHGLLPLFDKDNRKGQHSLGINDYQYLAEGLGLRMQGNSLPEPVTRAASLDTLKGIAVNRTATLTQSDGTEEYGGTAKLKDGTTLKLDLFIKPVDGGFVIDPPEG
jgi:hypothetical protein